MDNKPITAVDFMMKNAKAGQMMLTRAKIDDKDETIVLVREDNKFIKRLGYRPTFDMRAGIFEINHVRPVVMQMLVNQDTDLLYETFYNYLWQDNEGEEIYNDLISQDKLRVIFLNENGDFGRKLEINNGMKYLFQEGGSALKESTWSMKEFDKAKEIVYKKFPTPEILFDNLKRL